MEELIIIKTKPKATIIAQRERERERERESNHTLANYHSGMRWSYQWS